MWCLLIVHILLHRLTISLLCFKDARHPIDDGFDAQQMWSVLGVRVSSPTSSLSGYLGQYSFSVNVTNIGVDLLYQLTLQVGIFNQYNIVFSSCDTLHYD